MKHGFTLLELLGVTAVIGVLGLLLAPVAATGVASARTAACAGNLRQMSTAYQLYIQASEGQFFPFREEKGAGYLYYFGYDANPAAPEGARVLDKSQARLAPYLAGRPVETCPAFPYGASYYKRKYGLASYGYGLNVFMLTDQPEQRQSGVQTWFGIQRPSATLLWADAAQINTHQYPASATKPMLEEWYYVHQRRMEKPAFHFRHQGQLQAAFCDGSIRSIAPNQLMPQVDGLVGYVAPRGSNQYLTVSSQ